MCCKKVICLSLPLRRKENKRRFWETTLLKQSFPLDKYSEQIYIFIFVYVIDAPDIIIPFIFHFSVWKPNLWSDWSNTLCNWGAVAIRKIRTGIDYVDMCVGGFGLFLIEISSIEGFFLW